MNDFKSLLSELASSTYEITPGKLPAYVIFGQSNAHAYLYATMQKMLNKTGTGALVYWYNHSGQALSYWYNGSTQEGYDLDVTFLDTINSAYEVRAIFWIQGESNALTEVTANFETYTESLMNAYISYLGYSPDINISKIWYSGDDSGIIAARDTIRSAQDNLISTFYRGHDTKYYPKRDLWHLNSHNYFMFAYDLLIEYAMTKINNWI